MSHPVLIFTLGLCLGLAIAGLLWLLLRSTFRRLAVVEVETELARERTRREEDTSRAAEKIALLEAAESRLREAFESLSAQALRSNNNAFLTLAESRLSAAKTAAESDLDERQAAVGRLVEPIRERMDKMDAALRELEQKRTDAYAGLREQLTSMAAVHRALQSETTQLTQALRAPQVRGRWGELQLRRAVEFAGMVAHCDFSEQASVQGENGLLRPDMLIRLPGARTVVVDAKAPLTGYLDACEATDPEVQKAALARHAKHLREHVRTLSAKAYWQQFEQSPDFVVLFLPGEAFFSAALQVDPELLEAGASADVLIATPTTLIALLRAIGCGWRQEDTAREAKEIARLGAELHQRLGVFLRHFDRVRKGIEGAADAYNDAVSSFESRLMPAARKFEELQGAQKPLGEPASVDAPLRKPSLPESETGQ